MADGPGAGGHQQADHGAAKPKAGAADGAAAAGDGRPGGGSGLLRPGGVWDVDPPRAGPAGGGRARAEGSRGARWRRGTVCRVRGGDVREL